jgi:hypothetical protein
LKVSCVFEGVGMNSLSYLTVIPCVLKGWQRLVGLGNDTVSILFNRIVLTHSYSKAKLVR